MQTWSVAVKDGFFKLNFILNFFSKSRPKSYTLDKHVQINNAINECNSCLLNTPSPPVLCLSDQKHKKREWKQANSVILFLLILFFPQLPDERTMIFILLEQFEKITVASVLSSSYEKKRWHWSYSLMKFLHWITAFELLFVRALDTAVTLRKLHMHKKRRTLVVEEMRWNNAVCAQFFVVGMNNNITGALFQSFLLFLHVKLYV